MRMRVIQPIDKNREKFSLILQLYEIIKLNVENSFQNYNDKKNSSNSSKSSNSTVFIASCSGQCSLFFKTVCEESYYLKL